MYFVNGLNLKEDLQPTVAGFKVFFLILQ